MVYVRKKTLTNKKTGKKYTYAYAVQNKWKKKGARQKVLAYMGKVHEFPLINQFSFFDHLNLSEEGKREHFLKYSNKNTLIKAVIEWELDKHEIPLEFKVDYSNCKVLHKNKPVALEMNKGLLSGYTLRKLIRFQRETDERETMYSLAKSFVEAGLEIPQKVIVAVFHKLYE